MPTEPTEQVDHKAEALRLLDRAFDLQADEGDTSPSQLVAHEALVHSHLAIAEGQELVARQLTEMRREAREDRRRLRADR